MYTLFLLTYSFMSISCSDLERLGFKYGTDKSKDDHGYTTPYSIVFEYCRGLIFNVTEIGVSKGQSLQMWNEYFKKATIYGIDLSIEDKIFQNLKRARRIKLFQCNATNNDNVKALDFKPSSMDFIIDDGPHDLISQEQILFNFWEYLKPGGYYAIEDVDFQRGGQIFKEDPDKLQHFTQKVFYENNVMFIDSSVGHRNWNQWQQKTTIQFTRNRIIHNSYLIIIQKRKGEVPPVRMNYGAVAMMESGIAPTPTDEILQLTNDSIANLKK